MANLEDGEQPSCLLFNGLLQNENMKVVRKLDADRWSRVEKRAAELIAFIQPNLAAEKRRTAVVDYVQRVIMSCFSCQVFTFGSVPFKTYLPDGDIDLTTFCENEILNDNWAQEVRDILEREAKNENAEFQIKEVQFIQAEVKVIKCLIENLVVDISFSQLGGLCTLCFLDEIDRLINHDHLFKRSVILIKAWCFYESRILGAHHGLISTYALEVLVLYIFHVFNNCFAGPMEVLLRFLEIFSNFDWDNFCVSLWGPVRIISLPDMTAEPPRNDEGELLLNNIVLDACSSVFAVFPSGDQSRPFVSKHFNVIDPLRTNNNLGRSVSKGNFCRIRSAFAFGARRLAMVLECPNENLIADIDQFFVNTLERHGSRVRFDAPLHDLQLRDLVNEYENRRQAGAKKKDKSTLESQPEKSVYSNGTFFIPSEDVDHSYDNAFIRISRRETAVTSATENSNANRRAISDAQSHRIHSKETNSCGYGQFAVSSDALHAEHTTSFSSGHMPGEHKRLIRQFPVKIPSSQLTDLSVNSRRTNFVNDQASNSVHRSRTLRDIHSFAVHNPLEQILETAIDLTNVSNCYNEKKGMPAAGVELACETNDVHQKERHRINMLASSRFYGDMHVPINSASHIPAPSSSSFSASICYGQRKSRALTSPNDSLVDSPRFSEGQPLLRGVSFSSHVLPCAPGLAPKSKETLESGYDSPGLVKSMHDESTKYKNGNIQMVQQDEKQAPAIPYTLSHGNSLSKSYLRGKHNSVKERKKEIVEHSGRRLSSVSNQDNCNFVSDQNSNMAVSQTSTSRSKPANDSSDGSSDRAFLSRKYKISNSTVASAYCEFELEASSCAESDRDRLPLSEVNADLMERISGPVPAVPFYLQSPQSASIHVNVSPRERSMCNSGSLPITVYPTTFFRVCNFHAETANSVSYISHSDIVDAMDSSSLASQDSGSIDAADSLDQSKMYSCLSDKVSSDCHIEESRKPDILNSDIGSHWLNLQYGRFCLCQTEVCTLSGSFPQMFSPREDHGRSILSANAYLSAQMMGYGPHLFAVSLQPGSDRNASWVYQQYEDEIPSCSGIGMYLSDHQLSCRKRESSRSSSGQMEHYDHEKGVLEDRERNWNLSSKTQLSGYGDRKNQAEKRISSHQGHDVSDTRNDRQCEPHKPEFQSESISHTSSHSLHGYSSGNSNVEISPVPVAPPAVFYPYEPNVGGNTSSLGQFKFGSFVSVPLFNGSVGTY